MTAALWVQAIRASYTLSLIHIYYKTIKKKGIPHENDVEANDQFPPYHPIMLLRIAPTRTGNGRRSGCGRSAADGRIAAGSEQQRHGGYGKPCGRIYIHAGAYAGPGTYTLSLIHI